MIARIKGIKRFTDRHGKKRMYHRASMTPIPGHLSGAALAAEVARLDNLHKAKEPQPGTLRLLAVEYKTHSDHWGGLRERTRADYERVFKWFGNDGLDTPLVDIVAPEIAQLRDKAKLAHEYKFANQVITTLKAVLQYGVEKGFVPANEAAKVERAQRPKPEYSPDVDDEEDEEANRPWTAEERAYVLNHAPPHLLWPVAIGLFHSARQGDILRMSKKAYANGRLRWRASKNRKLMDQPVSDDLARILATIPDHEATTLVVNSRGKPWTGSGFRASWRAWKAKAEKAGHIGPDLTFHGTRHTVATNLLEDGWEDRDIGLQLGQDSVAMPRHYSRRAKLEGKKIAMLETVQKANNSGKPRLENGKPGSANPKKA
jgi:integrase